MRKSDAFIATWERQRARGRWAYAAIHALVFAGGLLTILFMFQLLGRAAPKGLDYPMVAYAALGGFAYGLIRFNIRDRFYKALKGPDT